MKKRVFSIMGLSFLLAAFALAAVPAQAQNVEQKIQTLEQELSQLKSEQMELKKDATAAAAALPTFTYRPGGGLAITAADKSWEIRFFQEFHLHMYNHLDGEAEPTRKGVANTTANPSGGRDFADKFSTGDLFLRRNRTYINFCWSDCFYFLRWGLDADSGEVIGTQTADFYVNFSKLNPYYPDLIVAPQGGQSARYVSRSSETSAQVEIAADMMSDSAANNLSHRGVGVQWVNAPLGSGDFLLALEATRIGFSSAGNNAVIGTGGGANAVPSGSMENADNADNWTGFIKAGMRPFLRTKNKWLQKTKLGFVYQVNRPSLSWSSTTRRIRVRTMDRVGRVDVMDIRNIGSGRHDRFEWGFEWGVGPYLFRNENALSTFEDKFRSTPAVADPGTHKGVHGSMWSLGNELFLWSPKGFLTGSGTTAGSVQLGFRFARSEASCGVAGCADNFDAVKRVNLTLREWDLWYYIRPGLSVGTWWNWWRSSNTDTSIQDAVGCKKAPNNTNEGKSCDWHSVNLGLRVNF